MKVREYEKCGAWRQQPPDRQRVPPECEPGHDCGDDSDQQARVAEAHVNALVLGGALSASFQ